MRLQNIQVSAQRGHRLGRSSRSRDRHARPMGPDRWRTPGRRTRAPVRRIHGHGPVNRECSANKCRSLRTRQGRSPWLAGQFRDVTGGYLPRLVRHQPSDFPSWIACLPAALCHLPRTAQQPIHGGHRVNMSPRTARSRRSAQAPGARTARCLGVTGSGLPRARCACSPGSDGMLRTPAAGPSSLPAAVHRRPAAP